MKLMNRNKTTVYYALYKGKEPVLDADGYETSESRLIYEKPEKLSCSVSDATGIAQATMFGTLESYDRVIITDNMDCPIDENSVLFIDHKPTRKNGKLAYDYTVKRVAKSLNQIAYLVSKVNVS